MISRLDTHPFHIAGRGLTQPTLGGKFELSGLAAGEECPILFLDPNPPAGASQVLCVSADAATVVLKPCGQATARLLDEQKEPIADFEPTLFLVVTPGESKFRPSPSGTVLADEDFVANVDRQNHPLRQNRRTGADRVFGLDPRARPTGCMTSAT